MLRSILCYCLVLVVAAGQQTNQAPQAQQPPVDLEGVVKFESTTNLVVVNVTVKDRDGKPVSGLKKDDFTLFEDGTQQNLSVFEYEQLKTDVLRPVSVATEPADKKVTAQPPASGPKSADYHDKRLLVLYFDYSSMAPQEQVRAANGAVKFLETQMSASDVVAVYSYGTELRLLQSFTDDRQRLIRLIRNLREHPESELGPDIQRTDDTLDEDQEFTLFNTDKKLHALAQAVRQLAVLPKKKVFIYISAGINGMGLENQSQLRRTLNEAVKANVSFYPIDARGLAANAPAVNASGSTARGGGLFSGAAVTGARTEILSQQDTLHVLAADTGGKITVESNDLSLGIQAAQQDVSSYYLLGYYGTNTATDGKFRRIRVQVHGLRNARLEYRPGYYASKTFKDFKAEDKEQQLAEALQLDNAVTDLPMALEVNYFRLASGKYIVPVALKIAGEGIRLTQKGAGQETQFDFIGRVRADDGRDVASVRDTIKVKLTQTAAGQLARRSLLYDTAFILSPGQYALKVLARENLEGKIGTFETHFTVPDLDGMKKSVRLSSIVWSSQREKVTDAVGAAARNKKQEMSPLVQGGIRTVPSVTRVFTKGQSVAAFFEVYGAGTEPDVSAAISLYRDAQRVFESPAVRRNQAVKDRNQPLTFLIPVSLADLSPGQYIAQVTVIDESGRKVGFARTPLVLKAPRSQAGAQHGPTYQAQP
jgi:VWFA-related protein